LLKGLVGASGCGASSVHQNRQQQQQQLEQATHNPPSLNINTLPNRMIAMGYVSTL
jgi:hypothetical protein